MADVQGGPVSEARGKGRTVAAGGGGIVIGGIDRGGIAIGGIVIVGIDAGSEVAAGNEGIVIGGIDIGSPSIRCIRGKVGSGQNFGGIEGIGWVRGRRSLLYPVSNSRTLIRSSSFGWS